MLCIAAPLLLAGCTTDGVRTDGFLPKGTQNRPIGNALAGADPPNNRARPATSTSPTSNRPAGMSDMSEQPAAGTSADPATTDEFDRPPDGAANAVVPSTAVATTPVPDVPPASATSSTPRMTLDPEARRLVEALAKRIGADPSADPSTVIALGPIENVSHATTAEFQTMQERLAAVLSAQSRAGGVSFTTSPAGAEITHRLRGSAYVITADGIDQWELFIQLTPRDGLWAMWEPAQPIRVIRHARANEPIVLRSGVAR
jgi:hypothetical protein